ncbi:MAG: phospholipid/cholesterol/gamma-HCH transport system substrate-binding protein, partial [Thermoleophilaceae bacterium]|nr:phospholipid/cholesterol/gamma-HCH transport system substrate-binding protein [Thermoleophilaceae bacterium]
MQKNAPSLGRIAAMVIFSLSCFGLLLFLWLSFGGAIPLKAKRYELKVNFPEATTLAQVADVRISGVKVGTVTQ